MAAPKYECQTIAFPVTCWQILTSTTKSSAQAREVAAESAKAEQRAAAAALRAVEAGIALYAEKRDYIKLKDIAEASDVAGKVGRSLCNLRSSNACKKVIRLARIASQLSHPNTVAFACCCCNK